MDLSQIFTWYFWAYKTAPMQTKTQLLVFVVLILFLVFGIVLRIASKSSKFSSLQKGQMRVFVSPIITFAFLELLFLWLHYENVPFFSRRIWFLFVFLAMMVWMSHRARLAYKVYPEEHQKRAVTSERDKYLPKQGGA